MGAALAMLLAKSAGAQKAGAGIAALKAGQGPLDTMAAFGGAPELSGDQVFSNALGLQDSAVAGPMNFVQRMNARSGSGIPELPDMPSFGGGITFPQRRRVRRMF